MAKNDLFLIGAGFAVVITVVGVTVAIIYCPIAAAPIALMGTTLAAMLAYDTVKSFLQTIARKLYNAGTQPSAEPIAEQRIIEPTPSPMEEHHYTHNLLFIRHESNTSLNGTHRVSDTEEEFADVATIVRPKRPHPPE